MEWNLDKNRALCPQICEQLCLQIALGNYNPNDKLDSVRETAMTAGINPNTVQRAFETLEQSGILYSVRGQGWYISENLSLAKETLERILCEKTAEYFEIMQNLGQSPDEIKNFVKEWKV